MMKTGEKVALGIGGGIAATAIVIGIAKAQKPPPISPADIILSDLLIRPQEGLPGEIVVISVVATNVGEERGSYTVQLEGDFVAAKTITLDPGDSRTIYFQIFPQEPGTYWISVDALSGGFVVTEVKPPLEKAGLFGTVLDATTINTPIPNMLVSLDNLQTLTDASGYYQFTEVEPGEYIAVFEKEGYELVEIKLILWPGVTSGMNVRIRPTGVTPIKPPPPPPGLAQIYGVVIAADTKLPLANIRVFIISNGDLPPKDREWWDTFTGADGSYQLINLPPANYYTSFVKSGYEGGVYDAWGLGPITLTAGESLELNVELEPHPSPPETPLLIPQGGTYEERVDFIIEQLEMYYRAELKMHQMTAQGLADQLAVGSPKTEEVILALENIGFIRPGNWEFVSI